jgi:hypothetical protein
MMMSEAHMDRETWAARLRETEEGFGFTQGYKLLYCPWSTLEGSDLTFLSLNPGRPPISAELRVVSDERGNSYEVEKETTRSPITDQFMKMCTFLRIEPRRVLTGVVAPFRSDGWDSLSREQRAVGLGIGRDFWRQALAAPGRTGPIIVCSDQAARVVCEVLRARPETSLPAGWGSIRIHRFIGDEGEMIVQLPHLSRFRLFGRAASEAAFAEVLGQG